ncbi:MAG: DUF2905 domain-containing protein [Rhizomicrobium sp.]
MDIRRGLIVAGLAILAVGVFWPWIARLGLGRLPGDVVVHRQNFTFYFPIVTCVMLSAVLTLLFWLFRK